MDIVAFRSRPLAPQDRASALDVVKSAAIGAVAGTAVSGVFHRFGPPKLGMGAPFLTATLGVGLMTGLAAGALTATNRTGDRTNSMFGSAAITTAAFAVPGILIHGKMDFSGNPVNRWAAAAGVAAVGLIASPLIHEATRPRD